MVGKEGIGVNNCRAFLSITLVVVSSYLVIDLVIFSFSWLLLLASLLGFIAAHYVWPPKLDDNNVWYDAFEVAVDLPFRGISLLIRSIGQLFKHADSGIDL